MIQITFSKVKFSHLCIFRPRLLPNFAAVALVLRWRFDCFSSISIFIDQKTQTSLLDEADSVNVDLEAVGFIKIC